LLHMLTVAGVCFKPEEVKTWQLERWATKSPKPGSWIEVPENYPRRNFVFSLGQMVLVDGKFSLIILKNLDPKKLVRVILSRSWGRLEK
jgi:hypothetical protein